MSKVYPSLPPEIWIKIVELSYTKSEFTELWTSYRLVCRNLKDIVEHLFMDRHLKLITLDYMFGYSYFSHIVLNYTALIQQQSP